MSSENKWMVGVRFHSGGGRPVSHFYLVDGAISGAEARSAAVSKAEGASERAARNDAELDASWVKVQRVLHHPLGKIGLSAPLPHYGAAASGARHCRSPRRHHEPVLRTDLSHCPCP